MQSTRSIQFAIAWFVLCIATASSAQIHRDEEVIFYGPYLHWNESAELVLVVRGQFVEPERNGVGRRITIDRVISPSLFRYIGKKPEEFDAAAHSRMFDRLIPFLGDGESGVALKMRLTGHGGSAVLTLPKTGAGGQFSLSTTAAGGLKIKDLVEAGPELKIEAVMPVNDPRNFTVRLHVPPQEVPLLVISDVDDTVRVAEVLDRPRMIERVFLRPYEAVPGLADIYSRLAKSGAEYHFVSGSPWQISGVIEQFLVTESFPPAVLHCRQLGWDFWNDDPVHTKEFKIATIEVLLRQFRSDKVLLIGDDGEHDPEVYTEVCRKHADRIAGIWIRHVRSIATDERLADPRSILGKERAVLFDSAADLQSPVSRVQNALRTKP
jgi:hypothetical protein